MQEKEWGCNLITLTEQTKKSVYSKAASLGCPFFQPQGTANFEEIIYIWGLNLSDKCDIVYRT